MSNNSVKPLELVVSAIHCLREKKGSSPQNILRYLAGKYNVDTEILKPYVKTGLKRGVSFGLITLQSGLYRLNDILSAPLDSPPPNKEKAHRTKLSKPSGVIKKGKAKTPAKRRRRVFKTGAAMTSRNKRKAPTRRKKRVGFTRRNLNERRRKQKRTKTRGKKRTRPKGEKSKKGVKPELQVKPEDEENMIAEKVKIETSKNNVKI